jgi:hypothetical protein
MFHLFFTVSANVWNTGVQVHDRCGDRENVEGQAGQGFFLLELGELHGNTCNVTSCWIDRSTKKFSDLCHLGFDQDP